MESFGCRAAPFGGRLFDADYEATKLIADRINHCKAIFPVWVEWKYIKSLFLMHDGQTENGICAAAKVYYANRNHYPDQVYLNWTYTEEGNSLYNDEKFLTLLYWKLPKKPGSHF